MPRPDRVRRVSTALLRWPGVRDNAALIAVGGALALFAGALVARSLQGAIALCVLALLVAIYLNSRRAGLLGLWALWLLTPALRRVLDLFEETSSADPLALLPFLATGVIAVIELRRTTMSRSARLTLAVGALGFLAGVPMGLFADPYVFGFGLTAYLAGLSAFVLGWGDGREGGTLTLVRALAYILPAVAAYGVMQYFLPLPIWDAAWIEASDLESIGSPEEGRIRIFATLNSPGTFAIVLVTGIVFAYMRRREAVAGWLTVTLLTVALALTFVRSAWLALVVGLLVFAMAVRGRDAGRLVGFVAICLVGLVIVGGSNPTTRAFTQRITSLGGLTQDDSAQGRLQIASELLPEAVTQPLGAGVGQAGRSATLEAQNSDETRTVVDNGYISLLYQLGLVGFLLVLLAMIRSVRAAIDALRASPPDMRASTAAVLAVLAMGLVEQAAGDALYGISGAIFWYLAGVAFATRRDGDHSIATGG